MSQWIGGMVAAWGTAYLRSQASLEAAIDHVLGSRASQVRQSYSVRAPVNPWDEPLPPDLEIVAQGGSLTFGELLEQLKRHGIDRLHAAFPAAGNADGIGPGPAHARAHAAGSAVCLPEVRLVIVEGESTAETLELMLYTNPSRVEYVSVSEAQLELTQALQQATLTLSDLDVTSWNRALGIRTGQALNEASPDALPAVCPSRASHLLVRAEQVRTVLELSETDGDGGSVSGHEARQRADALRPLLRHARRALAAAYNSVPY